MNKEKKLFLYIFILSINMSFGQKSNIDFDDIISLIFKKPGGAISFLKKKCNIPKEEKVYFLSNKFLNENHSFTDEVAVKNTEYFINNYNTNIFAIEDIVKNKSLAQVIITFNTHHGIFLYFRKFENNKWALVDSTHRKLLQLKDTPAVILSKKVSSKQRMLADSLIKKVKVGMRLKEVHKIIPPFGNGVSWSQKYVGVSLNDTLQVVKYRSFGHRDQHCIYLDKDKKVTVITYAKDRIEHILKSNNR